MEELTGSDRDPNADELSPVEFTRQQAQAEQARRWEQQRREQPDVAGRRRQLQAELRELIGQRAEYERSGISTHLLDGDIARIQRLLDGLYLLDSSDDEEAA